MTDTTQPSAGALRAEIAVRRFLLLHQRKGTQPKRGAVAAIVDAETGRAELAREVENEKRLHADTRKTLDDTVTAQNDMDYEAERLAREVSRLNGRIEGLESALSEADATAARLTSENEDYQRWQNEHEPDKCESSRAELAREVERLREDYTRLYCGSRAEDAESQNAALRALLREAQGTLREVERDLYDRIDAALGAGKETRA